MNPFLLDDELAMLTHPLRQAAARRRYLTRKGIIHMVRPDGQPIVLREALQPRPAGPEDFNMAGLRSHLKLGARRG